jgi:antitoxin (DNA-binding transcriptional repressor) of toxin-antitoxin stability system
LSACKSAKNVDLGCEVGIRGLCVAHVLAKDADIGVFLGADNPVARDDVVEGARVAWSLAITRPGCENSTSRALTRFAYEHILFRVRRRIVCRGHIVDRLFPAYPRYLFVATTAAWELRQRFLQIIDFVRQGERIAILPDGTVTALLAAAKDAIIPTPDISSPRFHRGDQVVIRGNGVLSGQYAVFQHPLTPEAALIEIDWLGRWIPVSIDDRDLLPFIAVKRDAPRRKRRHRRRRRRASYSSGDTQDGLTCS